MSIASFSGLASGIQWRDLLEQVSRAETARRLTPVQREAQMEQTRITQLNRFKTMVDKLSTAARGLRDGTAFDRFTASAADSPLTGQALLTASASAAAVPGTYSVEVLALARAHTMASAVHATDTGALNITGRFGFMTTAADGTDVPVEIEVDAADSLAAIRDKINAADAGVTASVLRVADGSYRLTLMSKTPGATGIRYQDGAGGAGAALGFTLATTANGSSDGFSVAGSDAHLRINGVDVTRSSNAIGDAIPGVTLNLRKTEPGTVVEVSVGRDDAAVTEAIKAFVDAYNEVRSFVDAQTSDPAQPLARSSVLRSALSEFKTVLLSDLDGAVIPRLTLVGVSLTREGALAMDDAKIKEALGTQLPDVKALLAGVGARMHTAAEMVARASTGTVALKIQSHNNTIQSLTRRVDEIQERLDRQYERMEREFIAMEKAVSQINAQGNWLTQQINAMQPAKR